MSSLPTTGERTIPGAPHEQYWFARHDVVYRWLAQRVTAGERWLDAGSGEGYGVDRLTQSGARAVGVDLDAATLTHAVDSYAGCAFARANLVALPLRSNSFDAIVSLQVIEHLWDVARYLTELARVGRSGAVVYISTPNRAVFSPGVGRGVRPTNPFHVEEFDADQLVGLLQANGLTDVRALGVHHGPRISLWESRHGSLAEAQAAAVAEGSWSTELDAMVAGVAVDDFVITPEFESAQDLLAFGRVQ